MIVIATDDRPLELVFGRQRQPDHAHAFVALILHEWRQTSRCRSLSREAYAPPGSSRSSQNSTFADNCIDRGPPTWNSGLRPPIAEPSICVARPKVALVRMPDGFAKFA